MTDHTSEPDWRDPFASGSESIRSPGGSTRRASGGVGKAWILVAGIAIVALGVGIALYLNPPQFLSSSESIVVGLPETVTFVVQIEVQPTFDGIGDVIGSDLNAVLTPTLGAVRQRTGFDVAVDEVEYFVAALNNPMWMLSELPPESQADSMLLFVRFTSSEAASRLVPKETSEAPGYEGQNVYDVEGMMLSRLDDTTWLICKEGLLSDARTAYRDDLRPEWVEAIDSQEPIIIAGQVSGLPGRHLTEEFDVTVTARFGAPCKVTVSCTTPSKELAQEMFTELERMLDTDFDGRGPVRSAFFTKADLALQGQTVKFEGTIPAPEVDLALTPVKGFLGLAALLAVTDVPEEPAAIVDPALPAHIPDTPANRRCWELLQAARPNSDNMFYSDEIEPQMLELLAMPDAHLEFVAEAHSILCNWGFDDAVREEHFQALRNMEEVPSQFVIQACHRMIEGAFDNEEIKEFCTLGLSCEDVPDEFAAEFHVRRGQAEIYLCSRDDVEEYARGFADADAALNLGSIPDEWRAKALELRGRTGNVVHQQIADFRACLAIPGDGGQAIDHLVTLLREQNDLEQAVECMTEVYENESLNDLRRGEALDNRADLKLELGDEEGYLADNWLILELYDAYRWDDALERIAQFHLSQGDSQAALYAYSRAMQMQPDDDDFVLFAIERRGDLLLQQTEYELALAEYEYLLQRDAEAYTFSDERKARATIGAGRALQGLDRTDEARARFEAAIALFNDDRNQDVVLNAHIALAGLQRQVGDVAAAVERLLQVSEASRGQFGTRGDIYQRAEAEMDAILDDPASPGDLVADLLLGRAELLGDQEAIETYERVMQLENVPEARRLEAQVWRAFLLWMTGSGNTTAIEELTSAIEDPAISLEHLLLARRFRGEMHAEAGGYDLAIADFNAVIDHPQVRDSVDYADTLCFCLGGRGLAYLRQGDATRAVEDLGVCLKVQGISEFAQYWVMGRRGIARLESEDLAGAEEDFNACLAVEIEPYSYYTAHIGRGRLRALRGNSIGAREDFVGVLENYNLRGDQKIDAQVFLARLDRESGQFEDALAELMRAFSVFMQRPLISQYQRELAAAEFQALAETPEWPTEEKAPALVAAVEQLNWNQGEIKASLLAIVEMIPDLGPAERTDLLLARASVLEAGEGVALLTDALASPNIAEEDRIRLLQARIEMQRYKGEEWWTAVDADISALLEIESVPIERRAELLLERADLRSSRLDDNASALADLTAVVELPGLTPDFVFDALHRRAYLKQDLNDHAGAIADLATVIDSPDVPVATLAESLLARAAMHQSNNDTASAIDDVTRVVELPELDLYFRIDAYYRRAEYQLASGDVEAALANYTAVMQMPGDEFAWYFTDACEMRANAKASQGDIAGALADYQLILEHAADDNELCYALRQRAQFHRRQEDLPSAIADYSTALELSGLDPDTRLSTLLDRAHAHADASNAAAALVDFTSAYEFAEIESWQRSDVLSQRAAFHVSQGSFDLAVADYTTIVEDDMVETWQRDQARLARGMAHRSSGDVESALSDFSVLIDGEESSSRTEALLQRGIVREEQGELDAAIEDYSLALATNEFAWEPRLRRARLRQQREDNAGALEDYRFLHANESYLQEEVVEEVNTALEQLGEQQLPE